MKNKNTALLDSFLHLVFIINPLLILAIFFLVPATQMDFSSVQGSPLIVLISSIQNLFILELILFVMVFALLFTFLHILSQKTNNVFREKVLIHTQKNVYWLLAATNSYSTIIAYVGKSLYGVNAVFEAVFFYVTPVLIYIYKREVITMDLEVA